MHSSESTREPVSPVAIIDDPAMPKVGSLFAADQYKLVTTRCERSTKGFVVTLELHPIP